MMTTDPHVPWNYAQLPLEVSDRSRDRDGMTTWRCPGCNMTMEARAVACGHRCPNRSTRWVDFTPEVADSTTQVAGDSKPNTVAGSESWGDSNRTVVLGNRGCQVDRTEETT